MTIKILVAGLLTTGLLSLGASYPAQAQSANGFDTPAACKTATAASSSSSGMGSMQSKDMGSMDAAHKAMMDGMDTMNAKMTQGMMASDIDIAFVCGMLPHHQGAINMAKAELQYGKDPWTKKLAKDIIAAQEKEIVEIKDWLAKHAK